MGNTALHSKRNILKIASLVYIVNIFNQNPIWQNLRNMNMTWLYSRANRVYVQLTSICIIYIKEEFYYILMLKMNKTTKWNLKINKKGFIIAIIRDYWFSQNRKKNFLDHRFSVTKHNKSRYKIKLCFTFSQTKTTSQVGCWEV